MSIFVHCREGSETEYSKRLWGSPPPHIVVFSLGNWTDFFEAGTEVSVAVQVEKVDKELGIITEKER